jgi:uncharacterized membrane protein
MVGKNVNKPLDEIILMTKWGWKIPAFWLLGAITLLLGSMTASSLQNAQGSNAAITVLISLILFLIGGMFWISVATAVKNKL